MPNYSPEQDVTKIPSFMDGQKEISQVQVPSTFFAGQVLESQKIVCPATASATQADYFYFENAAGDDFAVWLDIDNAGTAPTGAVYTAATNKVEVNILTGDTAAQVAAKIKAVVEVLPAFVDMSISISTNELTIDQTKAGAVVDPEAHDAGDLGSGSFVVSTLAQYALPTINSKYFTFSKTGTNYYAWFNVQSSGVDPAPGGTGVVVALTGNETRAQVCTAISNAIDALAGLSANAQGYYVAVLTDTEVNVTDIGAGNSGLTAGVILQGSASYMEPGMSVESVAQQLAVFT